MLRVAPIAVMKLWFQEHKQFFGYVSRTVGLVG